ncbi:MAG: hypothetical protein FWF12_02865 [Betaproteobacteria bacterium]|nr:hypothetical protein [Betaproteobacteria bacterium]
MTLKHSFTRSGAIYWQRRIPKRHMGRYGSAPTLKHNLRTRDPAVAARKIAQLDDEHDALWLAMDKDPSIVPPQVRNSGAVLLEREYGIQHINNACENALDAFLERIEDKCRDHALAQFDPEHAYATATPEEFLDPAEVAALALVRRKDAFLLSDAIEVYQTEHRNAGQQGFDKTIHVTRMYCAKFTKLLGNKELSAYTREDVKTFRDFMLSSGSKTTSVRRCFRSIAAVFRKAIAEWALQLPDIWDRVTIRPRPNSRVTSRHSSHAKSSRVLISRSNLPYGLTCSQIKGVSAA